MKKNEKGFTVIELVLSFMFVTVLSLSMYQIITNYKQKSQLESIRSELINFTTKMIIDIEQDITKYFLKDISYCMNGSEIINRCIILTFGDNTQKKLQILEESVTDRIEWSNGQGSDTFTYTIPYIKYGDVKYSIPDAKYVSIVADYMFTKTTPEDSLENKTALYKINIPLKHEDFDKTFDIDLVASGIQNLEVTPKYKAYNTIGQRILIQINDSTQYWFRVILKSSAYDKNLTLLYDDNQSKLGTSKFRENRTTGNKYEGSLVQANLRDVTSSWITPDQIRLLTAEEIAYITNACPRYKDGSVSTLTLNRDSSKSWLYPYNYWTATSYANAAEDSAWYVNSNGTMAKATVDANSYIRPVIVIDKEYVLYDS